MEAGGLLTLSGQNFMGARQQWQKLCLIHARKMHTIVLPRSIGGMAHVHADDHNPGPFQTKYPVTINTDFSGSHGIFFDWVLDQEGEGCDRELKLHMDEHVGNKVEAPAVLDMSEAWYIDIVENDALVAQTPPVGCVVGRDIAAVRESAEPHLGGGYRGMPPHPPYPPTLGAPGATEDAAASGCLFRGVLLNDRDEAPPEFYPLASMTETDASLASEADPATPIVRARLSVVGPDAAPQVNRCSVFRLDVADRNGTERWPLMPFLAAPTHALFASNNLDTFAHIHGVSAESIETAPGDLAGINCSHVIASQMRPPQEIMHSGTVYFAATPTVPGRHVVAGQIQARRDREDQDSSHPGAMVIWHFQVDVLGADGKQPATASPAALSPPPAAASPSPTDPSPSGSPSADGSGSGNSTGTNDENTADSALTGVEVTLAVLLAVGLVAALILAIVRPAGRKWCPSVSLWRAGGGHAEDRDARGRENSAARAAKGSSSRKRGKKKKSDTRRGSRSGGRHSVNDDRDQDGDTWSDGSEVELELLA